MIRVVKWWGLAAIVAAALVPRPAGAFWPADGRLVAQTDPNAEGKAALVADGTGGALVIWAELAIKAQHVLANGNLDPAWPAGGVTIVADVSGAKSMLSATTDGAGGAYVAWRDSRGAFAQLYAIRVEANGSVATGWPVSGLQVTFGTHGPIPEAGALAPDDSGGAYVGWVQQDSALSAQTNIYATRLLPDATRAGGWPDSGTAVCHALHRQWGLAATPDAFGGLLLAWFDQRVVADDAHFAQRLDRKGARFAGWAADGQRVTTDAISYPRLIADGTGGGYFGFGRDGSPVVGAMDAVAQRLDASGAARWGVDGLEVSSVAAGLGGGQFGVAQDGTGGMVLGWTDDSNLSVLYASRIDSTGTLLWPGIGPIEYYTGADRRPELVGDAAGGVIFAWAAPGEADGLDVHAQATTQSGNGRWMDGGVTLCASAAAYSPVWIVTDGAHGGLVAWRDSRSAFNSQGIYVARVSAGGITGPTPITVSGLVAVARRGSVQLTWQAIGDVGSKLHVQRALLPGGPFSEVGRGTTDFLDVNSPADAQPCYYRLSWQEDRGWKYSGIVRVDPLPPAAWLVIESEMPSRVPVRLALGAAASGRARVDVYALNGRHIRSLMNGAASRATTRLEWDGRDEQGTQQANGLYFIRLRAPGGIATRKVTLFK